MLCRVRARLAQAEAALAESRRREVEIPDGLDGIKRLAAILEARLDDRP